MSRIGLSQSQVQGVRQELALQPRMLQSIEILQLPTVELEGFLLAALEENAALEVRDREAGPRARRGTAEDADRKDKWLESQPAASGGLVERLLEQVRLRELEPDVRAWVELVIDALDEHGYLTPSDESLLALGEERGLAPDRARLGRAIAVVQDLEPPGIGGRDAIEALLLQLDPGDPDYALLCRLLEEFLREVAANKLPQVARSMGIDLERLGELLSRLRDLNPAPGAELSDETAPVLVPEVVVERRTPAGAGAEAGFEVRVEGAGLPPVALDEEVVRMSRDRSLAPDVRRYLRERVDQARWILDALEQRKRTLLRTASVVFDRQRAFLERGPGHLVPLRMTEVAEALDLHVSTVSRAVAGKYAETPWGILPLRSFFQAAAGGDDEAARSDVREEVRRVIEAEDKHRPLSDDEVVERLRERGLRLARRTIAKYRAELDIPSSYRRRRF